MINLNTCKKLAIDTEIFAYDWLVTVIDVDKYNSPNYDRNKDVVKIWNNKSLLENYINNHEDDLFVGFNIKHYDVFIIRNIIRGFNPKEVSDAIIKDGMQGSQWEYTKRKKFPKQFIEVPLNVYDVSDKFAGLKTLEAFMGASVVESSVDFNLDRKLTDKEKKETEFYCMNDVEQTIEVFNRRIQDYEAVKSLVEIYFPDKPSYVSKTKPQLSAMILKCDQKLAESRIKNNDGWNIKLVDTMRITKYKDAINWYINPANHYDGANKLMYIAGVPHKLAWGGIHGAIGKIEIDKDGEEKLVNIPIHYKGLILHVDVNSYYPSLMIEYGLLSRNSKDPILDENGTVISNINHENVGIPLGEFNEYTKIYRTRLALKKAGKKKEQVPYKIILNSTYGICNDPTSSAYDPRQARSICANGQLLLIDLIEHLESYCELIQSNTDGIIIYVKDESNYPKVKEVIEEWENRTRMTLAIDRISEIYQSNVNNYMFISDINDSINELKNELLSVDKACTYEDYKFNFDISLFDSDEIISRYKDKGLKLKLTRYGFKVIPPTDRRGLVVKSQDDLDNDLPILNEAIANFMIYKTPIEETIMKCDELIKFQKIVKLTSNYDYVKHNNEKLYNKVYRVFASKDRYDSPLYKVKWNKTIKKDPYDITPLCDVKRESSEQFANTPDNCFIHNESVIGLSVPENLDKQWYIDLANNRLRLYGLYEAQKVEKKKLNQGIMQALLF